MGSDMPAKNYILLFTLTFLMALAARSQDSDEDLFRQPDVYPSPLIGRDSFVKLLEDRISKGDTIGKKYLIRTSGIRVLVSRDGSVDSAYVAINHLACLLHRELVKHLKEVQWMPARRAGQAVRYSHDIHYQLYFTKRVLKQYRCR
jgi:hypothetical protein